MGQCLSGGKSKEDKPKEEPKAAAGAPPEAAAAAPPAAAQGPDAVSVEAAPPQASTSASTAALAVEPPPTPAPVEAAVVPKDPEEDSPLKENQVKVEMAMEQPKPEPEPEPVVQAEAEKEAEAEVKPSTEAEDPAMGAPAAAAAEEGPASPEALAAEVAAAWAENGEDAKSENSSRHPFEDSDDDDDKNETKDDFHEAEEQLDASLSSEGGEVDTVAGTPGKDAAAANGGAENGEEEKSKEEEARQMCTAPSTPFKEEEGPASRGPSAFQTPLQTPQKPSVVDIPEADPEASPASSRKDHESPQPRPQPSPIKVASPDVTPPASPAPGGAGGDSPSTPLAVGHSPPEEPGAETATSHALEKVPASPKGGRPRVDSAEVSVMEGGRRPSITDKPHASPKPFLGSTKLGSLKRSLSKGMRKRTSSLSDNSLTEQDSPQEESPQEPDSPSGRHGRSQSWSSPKGQGSVRYSFERSLTQGAQGGSPRQRFNRSNSESAASTPASSPGKPASVKGSPKSAGRRITGTWYAVASAKEEDVEDHMQQEPIIVYVTSVRAIRKTYDACETVKSIFLNYGVAIDERDISMSIGFRQELKERMGTAVPVPRVFFGDKYLGGYEEVMQMNECEELRQILLEGGYCRGHAATKMCEMCGNMRFVPCPLCNGSCKIPDEDGDIFRCPDCNENGCVRCEACGDWGAY